MREIKFRVFLNKFNKIMDVDFIDFMEKEITIIDDDGKDFFFSFDEVELIQYTGLKDSIGNEIYEGDILEDAYIRGLVEFGEGKFLFNWDNISQDLWEEYDNLVIIGNILENPELLNEV